jgi:hypothetical protein
MASRSSLQVVHSVYIIDVTAPFSQNMMMQSQPLIGARGSISAAPPATQLDWDQEFSRVADDVKGKGKAKIEEVDVNAEEKAEIVEKSADEDYMSDFEK